jgi:hypothetical protein
MSAESHWWNDTEENRINRRKSWPSATLSANPIRIDPVTGPGLRSEKPATNCLSHHTAIIKNLYKKLSQYTPRMRLGVRRYCSYSFTTTALDGVEWSASRPGRALAPGRGPPRTHCTGGWVGPRAGLDIETSGKIPSPLLGIEPRSSGHPARSQALYWLSYPLTRTYILYVISVFT